MFSFNPFSKGFIVFAVFSLLTACSLNSTEIQQWKETEIIIISLETYENPWTDIELMVISWEKWFDPKTGEIVKMNRYIQGNSFNFEGELPIVLILD